MKTSIRPENMRYKIDTPAGSITNPVRQRGSLIKSERYKYWLNEYFFIFPENLLFWFQNIPFFIQIYFMFRKKW